jgi:Na+/proline symporter
MGSLLFVYFAQNPAAARPATNDQVLPHFIVHQLPAGLKGIMLSAILLASVDSPLASLSTSFVTDIYRPLIRRQADERHYVLVSRIGVAVFGIVLVAVAGGFYAFNAALCGAGQNEGLLWLGLEVFGITGGALLGVFLLGILTKRRANRANVLSMTFSSVAMLAVLVLIHLKIVNLGWSWLIVIGTGLTFGLSWLLGPIMETRHEPRQVEEGHKD